MNLLSHYNISFFNKYFNHLWLMFKLVLQIVERQEKSETLTLGVIKLHLLVTAFLLIGVCDETDWYQVSVAVGREVKMQDV